MSDAVLTSYRWRWWSLTALLVAEAMNLLDATIVQVAGPTVHADLGGPVASIPWFTAAYTLPFAVLLIVGGRLGDIAGRRRVFRIGTTAFLLTSLACALAPSVPALISFRALQGAAAAVIIPQTFGLITAMFTSADERSKALGTIGPVMGLAAVCGPVLGGVLTYADLLGSSWRAVFLVNVPLALAVLGLAPLLKEDRAPQRPRGLVETSLFTRRAFPAALATSALFFAATSGLTLVVVLHVQLTLGADVLAAGLALLPWSVGLGVASLVSGSCLVPRYGERVVPAGLVVLVAGVIALATAPDAALLIALGVVGVGAGVFTPAFFTSTLDALAPQEVGSAAGLLNAVQQFGATLGVAVLGGIQLGAGSPAAFWTAAAMLAACAVTAR
ncbi:MFS transporter [Actinomycetes bacterium KLBMP 9759]